MPIGSYSTHENSPDFAALPTRFGWPARNRHTVACVHQFFSHTRMITRAGSLVHVRVESGHDRAREDISGPIDHSQQFLNGYRCKRVNAEYNTVNCSVMISRYNLMLHCWNPEAVQRPTFEELATTIQNIIISMEGAHRKVGLDVTYINVETSSSDYLRPLNSVDPSRSSTHEEPSTVTYLSMAPSCSTLVWADIQQTELRMSDKKPSFFGWTTWLMQSIFDAINFRFATFECIGECCVILFYYIQKVIFSWIFFVRRIKAEWECAAIFTI